MPYFFAPLKWDLIIVVRVFLEEGGLHKAMLPCNTAISRLSKQKIKQTNKQKKRSYFRDVIIYDDICVLYGNNIDIKVLI